VRRMRGSTPMRSSGRVAAFWFLSLFGVLAGVLVGVLVGALVLVLDFAGINESSHAAVSWISLWFFGAIVVEKDVSFGVVGAVDVVNEFRLGIDGEVEKRAEKDDRDEDVVKERWFAMLCSRAKVIRARVEGHWAAGWGRFESG